MRHIFLLSLLICLSCALNAQTTHYVAINATGNNNGSSWIDAYTDLQTSIDSSSSGDSIFVKKGIYNLTATITMKEGVKIYGCFSGTEKHLSQRVFTNDSSELVGQGDSGGFRVITNYFTSASPMTTNAVLDGFVIRNGSPEFENGGGILNEYASPTLANLIITENKADFGAGGGIYNYYSNPIIIHTAFSGNHSGYSGGGGIFNESSSPLVTNVSISGNTANAFGGGIYNTFNSNAELINVTITGNRAGNSGGGINNDMSNPILTNVIISGNTADFDGGGGMANFNASSPILTNVTICGNSAAEGGGIYNLDSEPKIRNSIVLGNTTVDATNGIYDENSLTELHYSLVQDLAADSANNNPDGTNVTDKQVFVSPSTHTAPTTTGDYRLLLTKSNPAINMGNNGYYDSSQSPDLSAVTTDLNGKPRRNGIIDLGAYENYPALIHFVDIGATGKNDGSSWADAYTDLQTAINASLSGDTLFVKKGAYNLTATITMKEGVKIYGSFAGTESTLSERVLGFFIFTQTQLIGKGSNGNFRIITNDNNGLTQAAVLDGFFIQDGGSKSLNGGGIYNNTASPTLSNLTIRNNTGNGGGGIYNISSNPVITDVTISGNTGHEGGGICNEYSNPVLTNVTISDNTAKFDALGGGMYNLFSNPVLTRVYIIGNTANEGGGVINVSSHPVFTNVTIKRNTAMNSFGGGMANLVGSNSKLTHVAISENTAIQGGGIFNSSSSPHLINVTISRNTATEGGGVYNDKSDPVLTNVTISEHRSMKGAGMYNTYSNPVLTNVTITGNTVSKFGNNLGYDGGGIYNTFSTPRIRNSIILGNSAFISLGIYNDNSSPVITYSLVQDFPADPANNNPNGIDIKASEVFVKEATIPKVSDNNTEILKGDYRLLSSKTNPAIDMGNNGYYDSGQTPDLSAVTTDLESKPRQNGTIDLGAYENYSGKTALIYFVDIGATGKNDGSSWVDAYTDLQTAINASSSGYDIFVKKGMYNLTATITMKEGVKIYGSFASTESTLSERVLGSDSTHLIGKGANGNFRIITNDNNGLTDAAVLDGFVIRGGNSIYGGGIFNKGVSPTLTNLIIRDNNSMSYGGGIFNVFYSNSILTNVVIIGNRASAGGGMDIRSGRPVLTNVTISGNTADHIGGGIFIADTDPILTNVIISGNMAQTGGGMYNARCNPILTNITISGNTAETGGGIYNNSSNPKIRNSIILGNTAGKSDPGISNENSTPLITYSLVQGMAADTANHNPDGTTVTASQVFVSPATAATPTTMGDYRLVSANSNPAINAGNNGYFASGQDPDLSAVTTDPDGNKRFCDKIDMGAYENTNCATLNVEDVAFNDKRYTVFPNPARESIEVTGAYTQTAYTLYDLAGKAVMSGNIEPNEKIAISSLAPGMYLLRLGNGKAIKVLKR